MILATAARPTGPARFARLECLAGGARLEHLAGDARLERLAGNARLERLARGRWRSTAAAKTGSLEAEAATDSLYSSLCEPPALLACENTCTSLNVLSFLPDVLLPSSVNDSRTLNGILLCGTGNATRTMRMPNTSIV